MQSDIRFMTGADGSRRIHGQRYSVPYKGEPENERYGSAVFRKTVHGRRRVHTEPCAG